MKLHLQDAISSRGSQCYRLRINNHNSIRVNATERDFVREISSGEYVRQNTTIELYMCFKIFV